ncbi:two-partner secretion domain-containing protein [Halomonas salipaludis]|uniref:Filamentous haemagglutinin FhaB/tRNA nuclease CdiA-like TPS domain-containing protein n=1 Tax=Halomonas salipaludis TaxID=2032625 RepID=A0A2A2ETY6_9GAMM|nr:DUF637 domain-containing protein [Halomonas salipaludis]PAU76891.1 hypothetical protein CK498_13040 [Halomonas salipaludis]
MNRHCYRLIFNKLKGRWVVASEAASSEGQERVATPRCHIPPAPVVRCPLLVSFRPLTWSVMLALGLVAVPVHAQIAPDRSAPGSQRPHVVNSANGTPQVNITSPNAKGVSRNAYRQFDVDGKGAILNNARNAAPTQIGGWVQGNPNLANGEARVIVNEVNSSNPSRLHGAVEVAGRRAEVVIANPAGIDVNGAGFINAQGITLTTGQPQYRNGALEGYRVEGGSVRIHGNGFDAGDADYAAILARAAEVQAGVWAEELEIVAGPNRISADRQAIDTIDGQGAAPEVAIDVAHLGGMYAGKIHLMATERGVGVHHAGDLVANEIVVAADGRITNRGQIASQGDMHLASRDAIANHGSLRAGDALVVTSDGEIANRDGGTIIARDDIQLSAATLSSDSGSLLAAGVRNDGTLGATGDLTMSASQAIDGSGRHIAAGGVYAEAETVALRDTHTQAREIDIVAGQAGIDARGATLSAQEALSTRTSGMLRTDGASVVAETLNLDVGSLSNVGGDIAQLGEPSLALRLEAFDNTSGRVASNSDTLEIEADSLINRGGELVHAGEQRLSLVSPLVDNSGGLIAGNAGLEITAQELSNTDGTLQAVDDLTINAGSLNNRDGDIVAGDALAVEASGAIDNTQGQWRAERIDVAASGLDNTAGLISAHGGDLYAQLNELDNTEGRLESAGDLTLDIAGTLINEAGEIIHAGQGEAQIDASRVEGNDGLMASQGDLTLDARDIVLDGATTSAESIALHAENLSHRQGEMQQFGDADDLTLTIGQSLDNSGGLIAGNAGLDITAQELSNTDGTLQAVDAITINAGSLNNRDGDIVAGDALAVEASGDLDNTQGQWRAERIDVAASGLDNTAGLVSANGGALNAQLAELDNTEGRLEASDDLTLDIAGTLTNEAGEIIHAGQGEANIDASRVEGSDGLIASQGDLTLDARDIVLDGATTSAESIALHAENLSHRQGEMQQFGDADDLTLNIGQSLDNSGGLIAGNAGLEITAQALSNTAGTLQAVDDIRINAGRLNNRDGDIVAGGALAVEASGDIDNTQGQWRAERIDVAASGLDNTAGLISANGGALNAQVAELDNTQGRLEASDDLTLDIAGTLTNEAGEIIHAGQGEAQIDATHIAGNDGLIVSQGDLTLDARDIVLDGATTSAESIALHAENLSHRQGEMQQFGVADDLTLNIGQSLDNRGGLIAGNAGLDITAGDIDNRDGTLQAIEGLRLDTGGINNRRGELVTGGQLSVAASGSIDNRGGDLIGEQGIALRAASLDNRSGMLGALQGQLTVEAGALDNTQGRVETAGDLSLDIAGTLTNADGEIVHAGDGVAQIDATRIDGSDGLMVSQGELTLTADSIDLDGAVTSAKQIAVQAERLSHRRGEMSQYGDDGELLLAIREELDNREGWIVSHSDLSVDAGDLVNRSGMLQAVGDVSLDSGELDNRQGEIRAGGSLALDADGRLDNSGGRVLASRDATLAVASLVNVDGLLATLEGDLVLDIVGAINNRRGHLEAGGELASLSLGLDNRDGEIVATRGDIDTLEQRLDNRDGLIASRESLDLASGEFDNAGGTLQAGGDLSLDTHDKALLNTQAGTILGEGDVSLTVGGLDNTAGLIGAGTRLDLQASSVINRNGGALLSEADMQLAAASLDNRGGQLQALGDASLDIGGTLSNQGGLIRTGKTLEVSASQVSNRQTQGDDQGIEANRIQLEAGELDNRQGTIRADRLADIQVDEGVNNRDGLISSLDTLAIRANDIDNRDGTLIADRSLDLTTAKLTGDGRVLSLGDLALRLASDFTLAEGGEMMAAGDLHLATSGTIDNRGKLRAGETLDIDAARLINAASGELSGTTTHIDAGHLTNRGLIDGVETLIAAEVLDNLGSGRIYGDRLGIEAGTLNNDNEDGQAAVIAARERLDLGVGNLMNRDDALIFSAGDMAIGGSLNASGQARGQAGRVHNASATIEALGNLSLSTARLDNTNEHFETELVRVADLPEQLYIQPLGWDEKLPESAFTWSPMVGYGMDQVQGGYRAPDTHFLAPAITRWTEYSLNRTEYETQVVHSRPGKILAGGDMQLSGGELVNDKSQILAGGALRGDLERLENREAQGVRYVEESGASRSSRPSPTGACQGENGCGGRVYTRLWSDWQAYSYSGEVGTFALPIAVVGGSRAIDGSGAQPAAHSAASLNASAQGANGAQVSLQTNRSGASVIEVPALRPPVANAESSLALGDWIASVREGLEGLAAMPVDIQRLVASHHSLDEGDVERLTALLNDMVGRSSASPADAAPLGVIRSVMPTINLPANSLFQVNSAPTAHYLVETDPRFTNQREWLGSDYMLNALQSDPSTTHKRLGDGFYEQRVVNEQIMQLTGQRYLAGHGNDGDQYRALMNAGITFAEQHGLRPGVALTAEQMAQLTSDIVWLVEQTVTLEDGSTVTVLVPQVYVRVREGDLQGDGTLIAGNSLALDVKNDIANTGTLAGRELVSLTAENIANLGGRIGGNRVDLDARNDLDNIGGQITAGDSLALQAGRDLTLASTSERLAGLYVTEAGGRLSATAGRDLSVVGADLDSAGDLRLGAGRDLDITSTLVSEQVNRGYRLSSTEIDRAATLSAGSDLMLDAGRDLTLTAVDVSAQGSGLLSAGRDLSLETLTTQESLRSRRNTRRESEEIGTQLEIDGSLALLAGQDITARAAQLDAGDDLTLSAGRDISLDAGRSQEYEETRRGRTHTIDSQTRVQSTTLDAGGDLNLQAGNDLRLTASQLQAGGSAALLAGNRIDLLTAQEEDYSLYESRSSGLFSSRHQRDEVRDIREVGTQINAGDDIALVSGGDQSYRGARLDAGQDLALLSGGNIAFDMASDLRQESHERSSSNFVRQSASGEGTTKETLRQNELRYQGELVIQAAQGISIEAEGINAGSVRQTIDAMAEANPDLAWLQEMEQRGDIDWQQVKAIHDSWSYSQSGLGPGAALAISIVAAAWAGPAASGLINNAVASAMVGAGAGSLAGTGAVSLINNGGDLGAALGDTFSSDSLRGAATAALTAGATRGMTDRVWGTQTNSTTGATTNLNLSFGNGSDIVRFAGQRATQAAIDAGIRTAIAGGSLGDHLGDSLENAVSHVVSGVLFNAVGDLANEQLWQEGAPQKIALHALIGGSVSEAMGGDFATGALAAGASEALVNELMSDASRAEFSSAAAQIVGIVAAELAGGDVNDGAFIAGQVESYNRQLHPRERDLLAEQAALMEAELGAPQLGDVSWEELLILASGSLLDQETTQRFNELLTQLNNGSSPFEQRFLADLQTAYTAVLGLAAVHQDQPLTWQDGSPITAFGDATYPFHATPEQFQDAGLFNIVSPGARGLGIFGGATPYGYGQAVQHQEEIFSFGHDLPSLDALHEQVQWGVAGGGATPFTGDIQLLLGAGGVGSGARLGLQTIGNFTMRDAAIDGGAGVAFDLIGQALGGGDFRMGQTISAGVNSAIFGAIPGRAGGVGSHAAAGSLGSMSHTATTNSIYDENHSIISSGIVGSIGGGAGSAAGTQAQRFLQDIPRSIDIPHFLTPHSSTVPYTQPVPSFQAPIPTSEAIGRSVQIGVGHAPSLFSITGFRESGDSENE